VADPANPNPVLLHGFPASSHQYRNLIPALASAFHLIAPDYPGFGNSAIVICGIPPRIATPLTKSRREIEAFLRAKRFHPYGLFVQDYGGPVGFGIVGRHPDALEWLIIQNSNTYDIGLTSAWGGSRNALWKRRTPETEKPLAAFLEHDAIKGIYLHGARREELISPDNWKSDFAFMERPMALGSWSTCSTITEPMSPCTLSGSSFSGTGSRRPSSSGARTTYSSRASVARPT
jgi:pimeloyl-ACP methyl ester carboxylesterase